MTEAASIVIEKVVGLLFGVAGQELSYMWNYTENVKKLGEEAEGLKYMMGRVQQQIEITTKNGDELKIGVHEWMNEATTLISKADDFIKEEAAANKTCFNLRMCVNLVNLHHYGKKAANDASFLVKHQEKGNAFENNISVPTVAPGITNVYQRKNLEGLDTHKFVFEKICKSIEDESIQIIGIYGQGGVGKTTLAKEVAKASFEKKLFAGVKFVPVSQVADAEKIKENVKEEAKRIIKGEKILIILDDLWSKIELEEVGISCGAAYKNCKILLTSRKMGVCQSMNCDKKIHVDSLSKKEAWSLFKRVVGENLESNGDLKNVAMKIAKKCGGLPLLVQVVGNALKGKEINSWIAALDQLGRHAPDNIDEDVGEAYMRLKLSYDLLKSKDAKSCFLLCSLFPEDASIPIEYLAYYVLGLQMFNDIDRLTDARNRVLLAVDLLKSACLLLNGHREFEVSMHDVVRDVALLIASQGNNKFLVEAGKDLTKWPENKNLESCTGISLMANRINELPNYEFQFPILDMFLIQENFSPLLIPDEFIRSIKKVRVLDVAQNEISSLPKSLEQLTRLCMLNLSGNESLHEISILGELKALEILFLNSTGIKEIPEEIGKLVKLRLLQVKNCFSLSHIARDVISKLFCLEELHIGYYTKEQGKYNSLVEICKLLKLTYLYLFVPCASLIPEGYHFERLNGFNIQIRDTKLKVDTKFDGYLKRDLFLESPCVSISRCVQIIKVSQSLTLDSVGNLSTIIPTISNEEIRSLEVSNCSNLLDEHQRQNFLPSKGQDGLKDMLNFPDQHLIFNNLVTLKINECHKLLRLFSVDVASGLVNLQKLKVYECKCLEELIWDTNEETEKSEINTIVEATNIEFPCLAKIYLCDLPDLTSFHRGNSIIKYPALVKVIVRRCDRLDKWGNSIHDTPKLEHVNNVQRPSTIDEGLAKCKEERSETRNYDGYYPYMPPSPYYDMGKGYDHYYPPSLPYSGYYPYMPPSPYYDMGKVLKVHDFDSDEEDDNNISCLIM